MLEPISKIMLISMSIYIYMNFTDLIGMTLPRDTLNTKKTSKTYRICPLQAFPCSESVSEVRAWGRWGCGNQPALQPSQLREVAERKTANMSLSETGAAVNSRLIITAPIKNDHSGNSLHPVLRHTQI